MNRVRGLALPAAGCALAAAAAATGPYLGAERAPQQYRELVREAVRERQRRRIQSPGGARAMSAFEIFVELALAGAFLVVVAYLLFHLVRFLAQLARLRFGAYGGGRVAAEYDAGEESREDAETALRKRVSEELAALSANLDDVADPREVVIACYARMEQAFASAGAARRPDESPMELLARVLDELHVPAEDVRRLTALFSEARFSTHPVTDEMRAAARRSLSSVAAALAVPA